MKRKNNISVFKAEYDYRTFQINKVTDANDNITVFDFSPLGLLQATAVIGKGTEGDYKSDSGGFYERYAPSKQMEYDFFAFKNDANPVWVKTIQREQHYQQNPISETIVKLEYSDGFGRLLQTRAQAEDVIFGNETFGSSGLSIDQNSTGSPAVGKERDENAPLNVVVSGWKIYNNKGKVVEQYEPFFDKGFEYVLPQLSTIGGTMKPQLGVKIKMFYDPLGRVVKTVNPDGSQQRVIFGVPNALNTPDSFIPTPWESYAYDENDLAPLTNPNSNVPSSHFYTPKSSLLDAPGRTVQTTEHKAHYNNDTSQYENVVLQYSYDIRGNLLEVRDPYSRKVFEHIYDYRVPEEDENGEKQPLPPLWTYHIDSGQSTIVFDVTGKPIQSKDAKDAQSLTAYDTLQRPTHGWSKNNGSSALRLTAYAIYGEQTVNPKTSNLLGQLWQQYDESGKIESMAFDFKGNLLSKKQQVISNGVLKTALDNYQTYLVDWTGLPSILETQIFETSSAFDALNRVTKITLPENVNNERKEITPTYNRAGALEKVSYDGTEYVKNIGYNAKGQRLLIAFGNDIMTRYCYHNITFRLLRQRSEKYAKTQSGNTVTYTPQSGTNKQDDKYVYDLIGNIFNINVHTTACGVGGTDSLDRAFDYDPLYRVISGTGRENVSGGSYPFPAWNDTTRSTDPNTTRAYTRKYTYDKVGNVQQVKQLSTGGFTRDFNYIPNQNKLEEIEIALNSYNFTYDNVGNQLTENTTRKFEWDAGNRLLLFKNQVGIAEPTVIAQYLYDSSGNRVKKIVRKQGGSYEIRTYIDGVFEHFTDEVAEQNTIHIMDDQSRVASVRIGDAMGDVTPAIKYNLENNIYSSSVTLDDNGTIVNTQEYYPFGETSFGSYGKKRYQYVGKERDEESGLYYYGARYYSPWIARFISCDPLSAKYAQLSPYNYSDNNPINDFDIDGMQDNNTEGSEGTKPITVKINGAEDQTRDEVRSILAVHAIDKQRMTFEFDVSKDNDEIKNISETFEYNGKENSWYLMESIISTKTVANLVVNYEGGQGLMWPLGIDNNSSETLLDKAINTADKVVSNKTVGDVSSGGGLASAMVEVSAHQARKEVIQSTKKIITTARKLKISSVGLKDQGSKALKKIGKAFNFVGKILGITSAITNFATAGKEWSKDNIVKAAWSAFKGIVDIGLSLSKMNPVAGFVVGFAWTLISFW